MLPAAHNIVGAGVQIVRVEFTSIIVVVLVREASPVVCRSVVIICAPASRGLDKGSDLILLVQLGSIIHDLAIVVSVVGVCISAVLVGGGGGGVVVGGRGGVVVRIRGRVHDVARVGERHHGGN